VIGVVGVLAQADCVLGRRFRGEGDAVVLLGEGLGELGGSEYLKVMHDLVQGAPPAIDLARERALQTLMVGLASDRLVRSAHDCSDGGLAVTLAECCFGSGTGAEVALRGVAVAADAGVNRAAALFGESASRIVVSVSASKVSEVLARAGSAGVPAAVIGRVGGSALRIAVDGEPVIDVPVAEAERVWASALDAYLGKKVA